MPAFWPIRDVEVFLLVGDVSADASVAVDAGSNGEIRGFRFAVAGFDEHIARVRFISHRRDGDACEIRQRAQPILGILNFSGVI